MKNARHRQGEGRNRRVEVPSVLGHHLIGAAHGPDGRLEMRAAAVFEAFAGLEQRLLSDHAQALDLDDLVVGVGDDPMPADELRGNRAGVGDRDRVREDVLVFDGSDWSSTKLALGTTVISYLSLSATIKPFPE